MALGSPERGALLGGTRRPPPGPPTARCPPWAIALITIMVAAPLSVAVGIYVRCPHPIFSHWSRHRIIDRMRPALAQRAVQHISGAVQCVTRSRWFPGRLTGVGRHTLFPVLISVSWPIPHETLFCPTMGLEISLTSDCHTCQTHALAVLHTCPHGHSHSLAHSMHMTHPQSLTPMLATVHLGPPVAERKRCDRGSRWRHGRGRQRGARHGRGPSFSGGRTRGDVCGMG